MSMHRMKSMLAALVLAALAGTVPLAIAQAPATPEFPVVIAGSSALWQTLALGAYNGGSGVTGLTLTLPLHHWTQSGGLVLQDCRPQLAGATACNTDAATVWVVYDSSTTPIIFLDAKVDSVVGDRCFFAQPHCSVLDTTASNGTWTSAGANKISSTLWGDGSSDVTALPGAVLSILENTTTNSVNVAATDIRPEDAAFAEARVNSILGASKIGGANSDGFDGLGYNTVNPSGVPPLATKTGTTCNHVSLAQGVGTPIYSGYGHTGTSTDTANVLAFNITGIDPFSCTTIPTFTVSNVGAAPIVFVNSRSNSLADLTNATEHQLQQAFSGTDTDAGALGQTAGNMNAFVREPLSGTYNTTEATVMRYPTMYLNTTGEGVTQEKYTACSGVVQNPLAGQTCAVHSGSGFRYRGIGTGEVVNGVLHSNDGTEVANKADGIAYAFFSYGNVSALADNSAFGYIQLNGVDPIFASYNSKLDPGQPTAAHGMIPGAADVSGGTFPACENTIWSNGFSFPNLRKGIYRSWSLLRLVFGSTQTVPVDDLVKTSNTYVVTTVPDYVPGAAITVAAGKCGTTSLADLGLKLLRSHYEQRDGNGVQLGVSGIATNSPEKGGDMGGMIIPTTIGTTTLKQTQIVQSSDTNGGLGPASRPQ